MRDGQLESGWRRRRIRGRVTVFGEPPTLVRNPRRRCRAGSCRPGARARRMGARGKDKQGRRAGPARVLYLQAKRRFREAQAADRKLAEAIAESQATPAELRSGKAAPRGRARRRQARRFREAGSYRGGPGRRSTALPGARFPATAPRSCRFRRLAPGWPWSARPGPEGIEAACRRAGAGRQSARSGRRRQTQPNARRAAELAGCRAAGRWRHLMARFAGTGRDR